ncbi:DUF2169 family type VI secretion system accessory protein [Chitinimonas lacunae]|uniref:DUF2169 domain-containing protein n=1 Tax=Chitinimonas lacunae TaxID=1963018 RepID=A0ABV8MN40_9NEIS
MTTQIVNASNMLGHGVLHAFYRGNRYHCLFLKATFDWVADGLMLPAAEPMPLQLNDSFVDEPETADPDFIREIAPLRYPADLTPFRPKTDVVLVGDAVAPDGRPQRDWLARLKVGKLEQGLHVCGPRYWEYSRLSGWTLSEAEPVSSVALDYRLAFGGSRENEAGELEYFEANPVGLGWLDPQKLDRNQRYRAPQLLRPGERLSDEPGKTVSVAGFAPVSPFWAPRSLLAGNYQGEEGYPDDFELGFWNAAPESLQAEPMLKGGEWIELEGLSAQGIERSRLPTYMVWASVDTGTERPRLASMGLDLVYLDWTRRQVVMRWGAVVDEAEGARRISLHATALDRSHRE